MTAALSTATPARMRPVSAQAASAARRPCAGDFDAVVLAASAGGVEAFLRLLNGLPADYTLPIIAMLHMPEAGYSRLPDIFRHRLQMRVGEAQDKEPIVGGKLYFAPPRDHLLIEADRSFGFSGEAPVHHSRPSIDVLMTSAADAYGARLVGILLTGANADGASGLASITRAGGLSIVQDPAEAQVPTMPQAAILAQPPSRVLPLDAIRDLLHALGTPQ